MIHQLLAWGDFFLRKRKFSQALQSQLPPSLIHQNLAAQTKLNQSLLRGPRLPRLAQNDQRMHRTGDGMSQGTRPWRSGGLQTELSGRKTDGNGCCIDSQQGHYKGGPAHVCAGVSCFTYTRLCVCIYEYTHVYNMCGCCDDLLLPNKPLQT
jgi:hypothetical protein